MIHAPVAGLLAVWGDLVLALHGMHGFGGNVAEIYVYQLESRDPMHEEAIRRWGRESRDDREPMPLNFQPILSMRHLLLLFRDTYNCDITIDGVPFIGDGCALPHTNHRWHVAITLARPGCRERVEEP